MKPMRWWPAAIRRSVAAWPPATSPGTMVGTRALSSWQLSITVGTVRRACGSTALRVKMVE